MKLPKRVKLPKISTVRNRCDALLTPIIQKLHPLCLLCGAPTEVGHHFFFKSQSRRLQHELENIIPLCTKCHGTLHRFKTNIYTGDIIQKKGTEWYGKLSKMRQEYLKADVHHYLKTFERLQDIYRNL